MKPANAILSAYRTTIFTVMSALAEEHGAINLGQGFPDEEGPEDIRRIAAEAVRDGPNQYPPMLGLPALREAVADVNKRFYGLNVDWQTEVMVTSGATEALADCFLGLINPGDEVVLMEPLYDSYLPVVRRAGGVPRLVRMAPPDWALPQDALEAAFSEKTKLLVLNSPHNPAGKVFSSEELVFIARLLERFDAYAVCDEVYEHLVFDGRAHVPLMTLPGMRERTLRIGSAGKTFSATGWKVGYITAAPPLLAAAAKALEPGSLLEIEMPDVECLLRHVFRSWWIPYFQPQHLNFPTVGNLLAALVEHGFRLPSACDNRPLTFEEFREHVPQTLHVSATPGPFERRVASTVVEQVIRPTGLVDPEVVIRPTRGQIDDLIGEIRRRADDDERVLITTLTKKMAEDLTDYLLESGLRVRYLHSNIDTVQRIEILRELRLGEFDALVGINLLREGLDLPEVSLVAILDADKEGFLRSETSLIQTIGRAARNVKGQVVMYADELTDSMRRALHETNRRRELQLDYNAEHDIDPQTIRKKVGDIIQIARAAEAGQPYAAATAPNRRTRRGDGDGVDVSDLPKADLAKPIQSLTDWKHDAASDLKFEYAARLRDEITDLRRELRAMEDALR